VLTTTTLKTLTKPFTTTLTETALATSKSYLWRPLIYDRFQQLPATNVQTTTSTTTFEEPTTTTVTSSTPTVSGFRPFADTASLIPAPQVKFRGDSNPLMQREDNASGCNGLSYPQAVQCKSSIYTQYIGSFPNLLERQNSAASKGNQDGRHARSA
jgi:hypothetical protein